MGKIERYGIIMKKYNVTTLKGYDSREFRTWRDLITEIQGNHYTGGGYSMLLIGNKHIDIKGNYFTSVKRISAFIADSKHYNYPLTLTYFKKWIKDICDTDDSANW